jgi:co-chaperonin GroES (HSP10)
MALPPEFDQKQRHRFTHRVSKFTPLRDYVFVSDMHFGARKLASGIQLLGDDGKTDGIRPRWGKIWAVGDEQKELKVGQWILIEHGRWTRGIVVDLNGEERTINRVDTNSILLVSDEEPNNIDTITQAVYGEKKERIDWTQQ